MPEDKPFFIVPHAERRRQERNIDPLWLQMVLDQPDERARQDGRETRWRLWRKIPQNGDRVLCLVLDEHDDRFEIVTVFFDRRKKQ